MADEVLVPLYWLESVKQTMTSAFYFSQTVDLGESYRKLNPDARWSPMTQQLSREIELVQGLIDEASDSDEDNPEEDDDVRKSD